MTSSDYNGIPSNKVSFMKEIFIPPYTAKSGPDSKGDKEEKIIAVTTKELCDYYKKQRGRGITTDNLKKQFLNELLANDIIGEIKSEIDARQNMYYPLVEVEEEHQEEDRQYSNNSSKEDNKQQKQKITKLSNEAIFDNFLQCPHIKLPKNYKDVPENWLIYEILTLAKYRIDISSDDGSCFCNVKDVFDHGQELQFLEKSNGNPTRLTVKDFVSKYEYSDPVMSIRYILKGDFYEFSSKIFGNMIGICLLNDIESKKLSNSSSFDNLVIYGNSSSIDPSTNDGKKDVAQIVTTAMSTVARNNTSYQQAITQRDKVLAESTGKVIEESYSELSSTNNKDEFYWTKGKWREQLQHGLEQQQNFEQESNGDDKLAK
jgi:hypothetical protein